MLKKIGAQVRSLLERSLIHKRT